jgi:MFS family permease
MTNTHLLTMHQSSRHFASSQKQLLISVFLKAMADSLITIYVPIYLLIHGVSLRHVMAYCIVVYASTYVCLQVALKASQYIGMKKVLSGGIIMTAAFYCLLHSLIIRNTYIDIGCVDGAALGLYYGAYDLLLTKSMKRSREGNGFTLQQLAGMMAGVLGPLLGSLIIKELSFQDLFGIVIVVLAITPLPLFFSRDMKARREPLNMSAVFRGNPTHRRVDRAVFLQGILYGSGTIWPLYLYIHYPHIIALGILSSFSAGLVMVWTFIVGKRIDRQQRSAYSFGAISYAPTWLTRLIFISPIGLAVNACMSSVLAIAPTMAVARDIFHVAKTSKSRAAHFSRIECCMDGGRIGIFAVAFVANNLTAMFIVSSVATISYLSCRPRKVSHRASPQLAS